MYIIIIVFFLLLHLWHAVLIFIFSFKAWSIIFFILCLPYSLVKYKNLPILQHFTSFFSHNTEWPGHLLLMGSCQNTAYISSLKCIGIVHLISSHLSPLTSEVVGAPQITLQQYLSTLPGLLLPSGNLQTPFPSIYCCYLPMSSSGFLSCLLLSLSPAKMSSQCPRILRCDHTIWVSFSLPWSGDHQALQLHPGFCCEPPLSSHGLCRKYSEVSYSISSQRLWSFSRFLLLRSSSHRHKGR